MSDMLQTVLAEIATEPSPALLRAVHDAVDGRPLDAWIVGAVQRVARNLVDDPPTVACGDEDTAHDVADFLTATDAPTLVAWLASNARNADIVDQANEDYGTWEMFADDARRTKRCPAGVEIRRQLLLGQLHMLRAIAESVIEQAQQTARVRAANALYESIGAL